MESERRLLFRQGVIFLLVSAVLGLVVAAPAPHAEKWRTAHLTGLVTAILLFGLGSLWRDLRLTPRSRRVGLIAGLLAAWVGLALNVFAAWVNFPSAVSEPGRMPDAPWQAPVFFSLLAVVVPATFIGFGLLYAGLRGEPVKP